MKFTHWKCTNFILVVMVIGILFSCDYHSNKEYIQEIAPPSAVAEININLLPPGDTLELFMALNLNYQFDSEGRQFSEGYFKLGNKEWKINHPEGQLSLNPEDFEPGYHSLFMRIYFRTNTGSLADQAGTEAYMAETEWVVVSDYRAAPILTLSHYKNDEGLLTLTWEPFQQYNFEQYELRWREGSTSSTFIFTNPHQTQFTDSCFFGKATTYRLYTRVKGHTLWGTGDNSSHSAETELPQLTFEPLDYDSVRISWNKTEYAARHTLIRSNVHPLIVHLESSADTSIVVASPAFGNWAGFELTTRPFFGNSCGHSISSRNAENYYIGQRFTANTVLHGYNFTDKILYTNRNNYLLAYNIETLELLHSINIYNLQYPGLYSSPLNNTSLAVASRNHIYVFANQDLVNPDIIYLGGGIPGAFLFLTPNNELATTVGNEFRLYNTDNQELITSFNIVELPYYSSWAGIGTSVDAGYAGITTHNGIWLYQRTNNQYEAIYHDQHSYRSILFHPTDPSRVYVSSDHEPGVIRYSLPGFTPEQYWEFPNSIIICNIDPHTGYMLLRDTTAQKLYVLNLDTGQIVFSINSNDYSPKLFNNRLISRSAHAFDISPYLPNPSN